jgi:hypothetical protein
VFSKGCQHYRNNLIIDIKVETISVPANTIVSVRVEKVKFYVLLSFVKKKLVFVALFNNALLFTLTTSNQQLCFGCPSDRRLSELHRLSGCCEENKL